MMLLVFIIGWLPVNILNILEDLKVPLACWPYYYVLFFTFHVIAMLTTCCNPLFYGFLNSPRKVHLFTPWSGTLRLNWENAFRLSRSVELQTSHSHTTIHSVINQSKIQSIISNLTLHTLAYLLRSNRRSFDGIHYKLYEHWRTESE